MNKYKNYLVEDFLHDQFFCKWVSNQCSREEAGVWEQWMTNNPQMVEIVEESKKIFLSFNDEPAYVSPHFFNAIKSRIDETIASGSKKRNFFITHWIKIAAIFIGLLITVSILYYLQGTKEQFATFSSQYAETKKIVLPDGSVVILNANSSVKCKSGEEDNREVWIDGEAFFSIKHVEGADKKPVKFIVHANDINVEVLGTQFNVNTMKRSETEVLLTKGKVRLSVPKGKDAPITMSPNDFVSYNNKNNQFIRRKVDAENYVAWLDHKYIFEKTSLENLCRELYHYYGKEFIIEDAKMRTQQLSGTLELQDRQTLIKTLSVLLKAPVKEIHDQIIIGS